MARRRYVVGIGRTGYSAHRNPCWPVNVTMALLFDLGALLGLAAAFLLVIVKAGWETPG